MKLAIVINIFCGSKSMKAHLFLHKDETVLRDMYHEDALILTYR